MRAIFFLLAWFVLAVAAQAPGFSLEQSGDSFGMRSHGILERGVAGQTKFYPLPQSTWEQFRTLRHRDVELNPGSFKASTYEHQEVIGTHQFGVDRIWIAKVFYDGESLSGVGAFGFFDGATRRYHLFSPREVSPYSISALLAEWDAVWLGLYRFGEKNISSRGLVRFDRRTERVQLYPFEAVVESIRSDKSARLVLTVKDGYAYFDRGTFRRFRGSLRQGRAGSVAIDRFPVPVE